MHVGRKQELEEELRFELVHSGLGQVIPRVGGSGLFGERVWGHTGVGVAKGMFDRRGIISRVFHEPGHCNHR